MPFDMNLYTNNYRKKRKEEAIKSLGRKCKQCGSAERLEFDHINPKTKIMGIADMLTSSKKLFEEELKKCQLLCKDCHDIKSREEGLGKIPWNKGKITHGPGYNSSVRCRCQVCRGWQADRAKEWRKKKKLEYQSG